MDQLNDDVLITILSHLQSSDIKSLYNSCNRFQTMLKQLSSHQGFVVSIKKSVIYDYQLIWFQERNIRLRFSFLRGYILDYSHKIDLNVLFMKLKDIYNLDARFSPSFYSAIQININLGDIPKLLTVFIFKSGKIHIRFMRLFVFKDDLLKKIKTYFYQILEKEHDEICIK